MVWMIGIKTDLNILDPEIIISQRTWKNKVFHYRNKCHLNLNSVRVNRLLKTFADIGLATQNQKKKYSIGPGIHTLTVQILFGFKNSESGITID
jgi:hypothetical protein